ncbi:unnamed protein product, partial [Symbiodinium sp. KB8]
NGIWCIVQPQAAAPPPLWLRVPYYLFCRFVLGWLVSYAVLRALARNWQWLDAFFSFHLWVPLARLTYSAYLIQFLGFGISMAPWVNLIAVKDASDMALFYALLYPTAIIVTFALAFCLYLAVEKPFMNLRIG